VGGWVGGLDSLIIRNEQITDLTPDGLSSVCWHRKWLRIELENDSRRLLFCRNGLRWLLAAECIKVGSSY